MSNGASGPPGWYDDPEFPGRARWWDGHRWAPAGVSPGAPGPGAGVPVPGSSAAATDLAAEHRTGRRAKVAVWVGLVAFTANHAMTAVVYRDLLPRLTQMMEDLSAGRPAALSAADPLISPVLAIGSQLVSLASLVVVVIYLVWFHRAVRNAGNLGLRLRLSPAWAVAGFLIPFASWVMPFLSAQDLFPPGHRGRRLLAPWWAAWLVGNYGANAAIGLVYANDTAVPVLVAVCAVALAVAAVYAVRIVEAAREAHLELARGRGLVAPDFDPAVPVPAPAAAVPDPWARASGESAAGRPGGPWG